MGLRKSFLSVLASLSKVVSTAFVQLRIPPYAAPEFRFQAIFGFYFQIMKQFPGLMLKKSATLLLSSHSMLSDWSVHEDS